MLTIGVLFFLIAFFVNNVNVSLILKWRLNCYLLVVLVILLVLDVFFFVFNISQHLHRFPCKSIEGNRWLHAFMFEAKNIFALHIIDLIFAILKERQASAG